MMNRSYVLLIMIAFNVCAMAQNCSTATMTFLSSSGSVPCNSSNSFHILNEADTYSYQDVCTNNNNRAVYYNNRSVNTGVGQCMAGSGAQPFIYRCPAVSDPLVTPATGPNDYNRMYNRAYGNTIAFDTMGNPVCAGLGTGPFTQDFQQCAGVACPTCSCNKCTGNCTPPGCNCPIIVDAFREGMHLTNLANGVWFDFNGNGQPMQMAWTDPAYHNAFLVLDKNHNGKIDGIQEMFGALTSPQAPRKPSQKPNGWLALAIFDRPEYGGNGDGVIDAKDAIYSQLLLWIDTNHNGVSEANELFHVADLGVTAIELNYDSTHSYTDDFGNLFQSRSYIDLGPAVSDLVLPDVVAWDVVLQASSPAGSGGGKTNTSIAPDALCRRDPGKSTSDKGY